mmetsp:Transcript_14589/g.39027  ORF Transcript_14589/g.39027 Transcript_14589/m.39027 type:complete len:144 (+) Transcript_14589:58-489(+)
MVRTLRELFERQGLCKRASASGALAAAWRKSGDVPWLPIRVRAASPGAIRSWSNSRYCRGARALNANSDNEKGRTPRSRKKRFLMASAFQSNLRESVQCFTMRLRISALCAENLQTEQDKKTKQNRERVSVIARLYVSKRSQA